MPGQSEICKTAYRPRAAMPVAERSGLAAFYARRRRDIWIAYKGRPAAKPASPPAEKAPPPKEAQPQAPAAPKPAEPAKEAGGGKASRK
jgi:hypothetical protein